ncbi:MAG TPA: hypothetical protein DEP88_06350 [Verrucomicrobiales bacterium]|nr:hypothetical protein [Verrucomicrobiales bacterium]
MGVHGDDVAELSRPNNLMHLRVKGRVAQDKAEQNLTVILFCQLGQFESFLKCLRGWFFQ